MGETVVIPEGRAVWVRAVARPTGTFRIRLATGHRNAIFLEGNEGDSGGQILVYGVDFVSPLTVSVDCRANGLWEACRTVQSLEDHSAVTVIWIGADVVSKELRNDAPFGDVIVSLVWTDTNAAADLLSR